MPCEAASLVVGRDMDVEYWNARVPGTFRKARLVRRKQPNLWLMFCEGAEPPMHSYSPQLIGRVRPLPGAEPVPAMPAERAAPVRASSASGPAASLVRSTRSGATYYSGR